ncbi:MAG: tetratricopeptide repeat protein [Dysgonamonadaceae bacterium]|jgi:tetratricopeptide (TPR) repeat protein|nr:tetratricopeptide repeat protein [Dysgonamonadaceae bacterium]
MASKKRASDPSQTEQNVGEILSRTDRFIDKYWRQILTGIIAVILVVVGFVTFRHAYLVPRERSAETAIFPGEHYFAGQQWSIALNGDSIGNYIGFEEIISEYGGTKTANLAKAYAGICQYNLGDYEAALKYFKSYKTTGGLFAAEVQGMIGDCQVNLGHVKQGIDYFKKAASKADNPTLSPIYLQKAAIAYESLKEYKSALEIYNVIKKKYPDSQESKSIDKFIERAKTLSATN